MKERQMVSEIWGRVQAGKLVIDGVEVKHVQIHPLLLDPPADYSVMGLIYTKVGRSIWTEVYVKLWCVNQAGEDFLH